MSANVLRRDSGSGRRGSPERDGYAAGLDSVLDGASDAVSVLPAGSPEAEYVDPGLSRFTGKRPIHC